MKKLLIIIFLFVISFINICSLYAAAQYSDNLHYKNEEYSLNTYPLEEYFIKYPKKRPKTGDLSEALSRRYIATYKIIEKKLHVINIEVLGHEETIVNNETNQETILVSVMTQVFPGKKELFVNMFNGLLVLPKGKITNSMGSGLKYEKYVLLQIEKGVLTKGKSFNYEEFEKFKMRQYEAFMKTSECKKIVEDMKKKKKYSPEFIDSLIYNFIMSYTSKFLVDE